MFLRGKDMGDIDVRIAPSILSADLGNLAEGVRLLEEGKADILHLDVMDGHFVPNITFGPAFARQLKTITTLPSDAHLMISHPMQYAGQFAEAGCEWVVFHVEADDGPEETIKHIKDLGVKVGMALNPGTPLSAVEPYISELDMLVVMTVNPGFGGQKFMADQLPKIQAARRIIDDLGQDIDIMVDGGINEHNVRSVIEAGASIFVAGAAVFKGQRGVVEEIRALKTAASGQ